MKSRYIHFSVFMRDIKRHGGTKRSEQLVEVLSEMGVKSFNSFLSIKKSLRFSILHPFIFIEAFFFSCYLFMFKGISLKGAVGFSLRAVYPIHLIKKYNPDTVIYESSSGFTLVFMLYMKRKKIKYVVIPHNIEFMVPCQNHTEFRNLSSAFSCEVEGYKAAHKVKVICDYDKSILACLGIKASIFHYYPTKDDLASFIEIRKKRSSLVFDNVYLVLGTVENKPTYDGIKSLLELKISHVNDFKIIVAGYGTEEFESYSSNSISILGSVHSAQLQELLVTSKALLINQPQSTGFLTKIIEFNLCGIPTFVISDYVQAKCLENYGVYSISIHDFDFSDSKSPVVFFKKPSSKNLVT